MAWWSRKKDAQDLGAGLELARRALEQHEYAEVWNFIASHAAEVGHAPELDTLWTDVVERAPAPTDEVLEALFTGWVERPLTTLQLGEVVIRSLEEGGFEDYADARARAEQLVSALQLAARAIGAGEDQLVAAFHHSLANALRLAGPGRDAEAVAAYEAIIASTPGKASSWYNLGLLHKQRRRFAEGVVANRRARELGDDSEAVLWNLGICATGALDGETALEAWRALGMTLEQGEDGLPFMPGLGMVQVRLSTEGDRAWEGEEPEYEHVWIRRLSPCHGRVLSPTMADFQADYGDLVLHDGAAIGFRMQDGQRIPRFPQLGVLRKGEERCFRFAALQVEGGQVAALEELLPEGCLLYPHTEQVEMICRECVRGSGRHEHRPTELRTHRQLFGKLVVPARMEPAEYLRHLQAALVQRPHLTLASPALHLALGDEVGARRAEQTWEQIEATED
ncbi:MAG: hypothetical protein L0Y66_21835 [Myxococcaceae bacterium]|nr:hypothetical protein [Myxococcaceae bacterium]MCI0673987.1 hypothetical protein [Myxococcaceae bacterium]